MYDVMYTWNLKKKKKKQERMYMQSRKRVIDMENKSGYQRRKERGRGKLGV